MKPKRRNLPKVNVKSRGTHVQAWLPLDGAPDDDETKALRIYEHYMGQVDAAGRPTYNSQRLIVEALLCLGGARPSSENLVAQLIEHVQYLTGIIEELRATGLVQHVQVAESNARSKRRKKVEEVEIEGGDTSYLDALMGGIDG